MEKTAILQKFSFFHALDPATRDAVARAAEPARLPAGAYFFHEGEPCRHFALVGAGDVRVFKSTEAGRGITLYHVGEGQTCLVNMLSVTLDTPTVASAVVEAPAEALVIEAGAVRAWAGTSEALRSFLFETMARRLMDVMALVEEVAFRRMDRRLAELLVRRFARSAPTLPAFTAATHEELALELGTAREVVTRLLRELERRGAVVTGRGRIELRDECILQQAAGG